MDTAIFDLDDTLADTWHATVKANRRLFLFFVQRRMLRLVKALVLRENVDFIANNKKMLLQTPHQVIDSFIRIYYPSIDPSVVNGATSKFNKTFYDNFRLIDDAKEVLGYLKDKYRLCLVTDGTPEEQNKKIDHLGIRHFFERIVIAGDLGTSKPDPENFRLALGQDSGRAYVIGDRLETDIMGGRAIGATTILFKNGFFKNSGPHEISPDITIDRLLQIKDIL